MANSTMANHGRAASSTPPQSLAQVFESTMLENTERRCLGWRVPSNNYNGESFQWITYGEFFKSSTALAQALSKHIPSGATIGICGANCYEWFASDFAALWMGATSVPMCDKWDASVRDTVLANTNVGVIVCSPKFLPQMICSAGKLHNIKLIVTMGETDDESTETVSRTLSQSLAIKQFTSCPIKSFGSLIRQEQDSRVHKIVARAPKSPHTILHTSGTTGLPKGVVYTDELWLSNMVKYPDKEQVAFSYMPLAYITDRHTVYTSFYNGGSVGILTTEELARQCSPRAKYDLSQQIFRDLQTVQPTILKGVPKFWESVSQTARMVQDQSLNILGGRTKVLLCGAGALHQTTSDFFRRCKVNGDNVLFIECYGATECGNIAVNHRFLPHVQWTLLPAFGTDMGATSGAMESDAMNTDTETRKGKDVSEGHLVVRTGEMMFSGYHNDVKRTKASFTKDGFYETGDLVRVQKASDGGLPFVHVIGRVKTSIKLSNGLWCFPESLEDSYRQATSVSDIFVYGDNQHEHLVAVVSTNMQSQNVNEDEYSNLFLGIWTTCGLPSHARISKVIKADAPFSRENNMLNATGKVHRANLFTQYRERITTALSQLALDAAIAPLDHTSTFVQQGGTSLGAAKLAALYQQLGVPMDRVVKLLLDDSISVGRVVKEIKINQNQVDPRSDLDLLDGFYFPTNLTKVPESAFLENGEKWTLLTGASGFVGSFLLCELLARGDNVVCLLRAPNKQSGMQRLLKILSRTRRYQSQWWDSLEIICTSVEKFDQHHPDFERISKKVSTVYHSAAMVNLKANYTTLRPANIVGTLNMIQLARVASARFVFVSTTDVLTLSQSSNNSERRGNNTCVHGCNDDNNDNDIASKTQSETNKDDDNGLLTVDDFDELESGYATSKLVGEILVTSAIERGLDACVARLGMIGGDSVHGTCNPKDFVMRMLIGFSHTRAFPETTDDHTMVHWLPVDTAAMAIADLGGTKDSPEIAKRTSPITTESGFAVNIVSGAPLLTMPELRSQLLNFGGPFFELDIVSFPKWIELAEVDGALSVWPILSWTKGREEFPKFNSRHTLLRTSTSTESKKYFTSNTRNKLQLGANEATLNRTLKFVFYEEGVE
eukprot:m.140341 g.140341  ORF g.140341 m.140341 type:complete len:1118 (+) comp30109_c0_seq6:188-3541(+)